MEEKMNKYGIILDGRMDEPAWDTAEAHTGFRRLGCVGGMEVAQQTIFKILPCEDRVFIGIQCMEPNGMAELEEARRGSFVPGLEVFISPSGSDYEFYQFVLDVNGKKWSQYYSESGNIKPDRYAPDWSYKLFFADTYYSVEIEIPLTAFYWTPYTRWSTKWLWNITRNHFVPGLDYATWAPMQFGFLEVEKLRPLEGFPTRPVADDVCIMSAITDLTEEREDGYHGIMTIKTNNAVADTYEFVSNHTDTIKLSLQAGSNEFTVPCYYSELGRNRTMLSLVRVSDGKEFKRYYPVRTKYEPIKLSFILPEYRNNFYPGQDHSKIQGVAISEKPVTLKLEGPGITTTTITPDADGSFHFDTPDFEIGEAYLTATIDGYEIKKKIRRLAPTGHMMTWISGGNLVVNGKPTLRRDMYARYYQNGTAFKKKYDADNLHETWLYDANIEPRELLPGSEGADGEAAKDQMPSEEMLRKVDEIIEWLKDKDFAAYYISDEPECRGLSVVYFENLYNYVAEKDPYHVLLTATRSADANVDMADWFETHPYICPFNHPDGTRTYLRPLYTVGKFVDDIVNLNRPDKCIGFLPTCYASNGATGGFDYPTLDEYICHTWAAMVHGGKSLWPYAGHDLNDRASLYEGTRYVFSSFEALEDIVLHGKRTVLMRTTEIEAVLYEYGEQRMFVVVNVTQEPQTVTLDGISGTWHNFRHDCMISGNTFHLEPLKTLIGTNVVKDAGLPTYQQTVAIIDKAEYDRTHTGSLIFGRDADIPMTFSPMHGWGNAKILDGVHDNLAYDVRQDGEGFFELDLTKVMPTFNRVVVHGYNVGSIVAKVRNNGELSEPAVANKQAEEYSITIDLKEAVTPDALRIEWNKTGKMELYEIEVF